MWELDHKESWVPKNWCFWTVMLEKTLESPLDSKEIKPVHPKGDQSSIHWKDWCGSWNSNTLATWCEELTHLKSPWFWERSKEKGEGVDRGWDGWMASLTPHWVCYHSVLLSPSTITFHLLCFWESWTVDPNLGFPVPESGHVPCPLLEVGAPFTDPSLADRDSALSS